MEYTDDQISAALMMGTDLDPARFELVPDGNWIRFIRDRTRLPDLFVYRHRITKMFGLAQWLIKPKVFGQGVSACTEICLFSGSPDSSPTDLPSLDWLLWRCQPGSRLVDDARDKRMNAKSDAHLKLLDQQTARDEMEKFMRSKGLHEAADNLSITDVAMDGEDLDTMRDVLNWASKGKVISTG